MFCATKLVLCILHNNSQGALSSGKADDAVAPKTAGENLVHASLTEERLDDQHQAPQCWKLLDEHLHYFSCLDPVHLIDAHVDGEAAIRSYEFDDGHLRFGYDGDFVGDPSSLDDICERVQHRGLVAVSHRL